MGNTGAPAAAHEARQQARRGADDLTRGGGQLSGARELREIDGPIRLETWSSAEGRDLIEALTARGLNAELIETVAGWEVEIISRREETELLFLEIVVALETWLHGHGLRSIPLRVGEVDYTVRPHADLYGAPSGPARRLVDLRRRLQRAGRRAA